MEQAAAESDKRLAELQTKLTELELASYDGTLLWKITEVRRRRREAVSGDVVCIQSPAFYTASAGQFHNNNNNN